jgi:hypothetical protein
MEQILLKKTENSATFLEAIGRDYQMCGIGEGLSFAEVEAYWHQGTPLSDAWLDALGGAICFEHTPRPLGYVEQGQLATNKRTLLEGLEPSEWFGVAEKCLYLLSPLQLPEHLVAWCSFTHESASKKIEPGVWSRHFVEGLLPLSESLAKGEDGWQGLHDWMKAADADPGLFNRFLLKVPMDQWGAGDDYSAALSAHFTLLVLMRLLLGAKGPEGVNWSDGLMPVTNLLSGLREAPVHYDDHKALERNHAAPILKAALDSTEIIDVLCHQVEGRYFQGLMINLGMSLLLAQQPELYRALVEGLEHDRLQYFWPDNGLAESAPDLLLYHVRRRYERTGYLGFSEIATPDAVAWYRARLPELQEQGKINECVEWLVQRLPQAETLTMLEGFCEQDSNFTYKALEGIDGSDSLLRFLACQNKVLRKSAASRLKALALIKREHRQDNEDWFEPDPNVWPVLIEQSKRYPDLFIADLSTLELNPQELERWVLLWRSTTAADSRMKLVDVLMEACCDERRRITVDPWGLTEALFQEAPETFDDFVDEMYESYLDDYIAAISKRETPLGALIPKMAARYLAQSTWISGPVDALDPAPVQQALVSYPEHYAELEDKAKVKLLPLFNDQTVIACGASLAELFAKANKALYQPAIELITRTAPDALGQSGLLELSGKKARKLMLTGLALHEAEDAVPMLRQLVDDKAHDDFSRGLMLDNLEARGESVAGLDDGSDLTLEKVQALAAKQKIPAAVNKLWNADLAESLSDLGEPGGLYLLSLINAGDGERLPRKARQVLELIPAGRRADFSFLGVSQWIAENGSDKLKALLPPLFEYGDERVANALVKACKTWKKTRKPKSSAAIRLLCRLPGNYGIAQTHALWESRQFSESIMDTAKLALTEAAEREGMSLEEFIEQLVPDFGLKPEGLVLDVGPYSYQVKIKPDLSLMVIGPNGKITKSFPKAKAEEDPDKRSLAENQFKGLRKNLKPVLKQQSKRLMRGFSAGKRWDLALWQRLFLDHPLMNIIAQGVVWGAEDDDGGTLVRFRPSDTGELLDLEDEPVTLTGAQFIHMVHPAEVAADERAAWQAHFKDYAVTSPIRQWEAPVYEASAEELEAERVTRQSDALINRGTFAGLMEKWGYLKGSGEDGGWIYHHDWLVSHGAWLVVCEHSEVSVVFEADAEVTVEALVPYRYAPEAGKHPWKPVALKDLPVALRTTLLAQAEALISAAIA